MFDFISQKFSSIFSRLEGTRKLTESSIYEALDQVQEALLEADVPYNVVQKFILTVKNEVIGQKVVEALKPAEQLMSVVQDKIVDFLGGSDTVFSFSFPATIMVMGLQGSGKTTTIAKLAYRIKKDAEKNGDTKKILVGSIDFYRPAALDQLEQLAQQVNITFYRAQNTDPVMAAKEILEFSYQEGFDVLLLDTAGRLHIDNKMLQEIQEVDSLIRPSHKLLVLDAMTGQESLAVAQAFNDTIGFHGAILTKMDSDTRGGAAFSFRFVLKKPIFFTGEGEKVTDLNIFYPDRATDRILGNGDLRTLIENATEKMTASERVKAEKSFSDHAFSLQDFADQMSIMNKMGSFSHILKYMPNMEHTQLSPEVIQRGERELVRFRAIISSMTPRERLNPVVLDYSRRNRIARGAGVIAADVDGLLKRFEEAKQYVKLLDKFGSI